MWNEQQIIPMLAKTFNHQQNVKGWLMSEKLDGVRAIWSGTRLFSRNGNQFFAPAWNGIVFKIGTGMSGALREGVVNIGAKVTFAYQGLTDGGKPRFPFFLR
jgi:hypothetical protein